MIPRLSCEEMAPLLSRELERPLPPLRWLAVRLHLVRCGLCARYREQLRLLRAALRRFGELIEDGPALDPAARERIKRALLGAA